VAIPARRDGQHGTPISGGVARDRPADRPDRGRTGSVIVFQDPFDPSRLVAHRVIRQLESDPPAWRTRGDANPDEDVLPVPARAIIGRVAWAIPGLGAIVMALRGWPAIVVLVGLPLSALILTELRGWRRRTRAASGSGAV